MAIILAIEPDRRQRDALAAVVRQSVGAELILADTTEHALEAIGNRVPDLVLVPALLSPSDDAALAAALRVIAAAAHVRTLTIPVLAAQSASEAKTGLFSRWRRGTASQVPDGCDPALFAEQIVAYLKESAAERALLADQEEAGRRRALRHHPEATAPVVAPAELAADLPPDLQAFTEIDEPDYPQPEIPVAAHSRSEMPAVDARAETPSAYADRETPTSIAAEAFSGDRERSFSAGIADSAVEPSQREQAYTRADAEIYTPADAPVPVYTPTYSVARAQPESTPADSQPGEQVYARDHDTVVADSATLTHEESQSDSQAGALPDVPRYAQQDFSARLHDELVAHVNGGNYDTPPTEDDTVATLGAVQEEDIDLSGELVGLDDEDTDQTDAEGMFDGERIGIYTMPSVVDDPEIELPRVTFGRNRFGVEPEPAVDPVFFIEPEEPPQVEAVAAHAIDARHASQVDAEFDAAETAASVADAETWKVPAPPPVMAIPRAAAAPPDTAPAAAAPRIASTGPKRDRPEWGELVASLRKDIERRRVEPPQAKPKPKPATSEIAPPAPAPVARRARKAKPIQDEWGFFDPEQCGFAALLAKLDEITEGAEEPEVRQTR
jgi:hypothetical protein